MYQERSLSDRARIFIGGRDFRYRRALWREDVHTECEDVLHYLPRDSSSYHEFFDLWSDNSAKMPLRNQNRPKISKVKHERMDAREREQTNICSGLNGARFDRQALLLVRFWPDDLLPILPWGSIGIPIFPRP